MFCLPKTAWPPTSLIKFIKKEKPDPIIKEIEQPDVPLWAIWAIQQYCKEYGTEELCSNFGTITEIIEFIRTGRHPNLFLHDNGLLYSYGKEKAISWMNSSIGNLPVVPRSGYLVEFNALWYNALRFAAKLYRKKGQENEAIELEILAEKVGDSFKRVFKNEAGYLFDYVDGDYKDWSVRPNMLFAISLEFSPLNRQERKQVLDYITKELLTPKGIRSLSPKSQGYTPYYAGPQAHRDYAYHQGTAWPWLMGFNGK